MRPDLYALGSAYHQQRRWTHPHTLRCLQAAIGLFGTPASLLDVGCAEGVVVSGARASGIEAMGIDLAVPDDDPALVRADLRIPVDLQRRFEWVLCWEVAEHLPASAADVLCDTLVRHLNPTGRVIFTAAGPGQRGPGHVHLAGRAFWNQQFADRGVQYADGPSVELRRRWVQCAPQTPWYGKNASVYWRVA